MRAALAESDAPAPEATEASVPKADKRAITKSITPDALISFVDNKPYKTLKRRLSRHGLDMAGYRERYGLPRDYPSVAPAYSASRSAMAKQLGLGARRRAAAPAEVTPAQAAPPTKTRAMCPSAPSAGSPPPPRPAVAVGRPPSRIPRGSSALQNPWTRWPPCRTSHRPPSRGEVSGDA